MKSKLKKALVTIISNNASAIVKSVIAVIIFMAYVYLPIIDNPNEKSRGVYSMFGWLIFFVLLFWVIAEDGVDYNRDEDQD